MPPRLRSILANNSPINVTYFSHFVVLTLGVSIQVADVRLRLSTIVSREGVQHLLFWLTGQLLSMPDDLFCPDGTLAFYPMSELPYREMVPTARVAIPFIAGLGVDDTAVYNGVFVGNELITTKATM